MCGIVGYFSTQKAVNSVTFDAMRDSLESRGPDGFASKYFKQNRIALGHRRLAINDLSETGSQPMCNEDGSVWVVFNGEIYNHPELAVQLREQGHTYRSKSDSETIIHAWEQWGTDCVKKLRGIFAFAIWDSNANQVFCARDHLGVKPFYYHYTELALIVASQPKAILLSEGFTRSVDRNAFGDYLFYGVVPQEKSIFQGIKKLLPGHTMLYENGRIVIEQYWKPVYSPQIDSYDEAVSLLEDGLDDAVSSQLLSDVRYGAFLSGGVDSSLICGIASAHSAQKLPSVSIGFKEKKHSELPYARLASNCIGTEYHEHILSRSEALELVKRTPEVFDEPYGLGAAVPLMCISEFTQRLGIKVMIAGDGADELFAGYHHYDRMSNAKEPFNHYQPHEAIVFSQDELALASSSVKESLMDGPKWRYDQFSQHSKNTVLDAQLRDMNTYLPDEILTKVDRASMACGLEVRVPFLDQKLVELVLSIDHRLIYQGNERKALLKAVARRWLPDSILTQRKKGFSIPTRRWISRPDQWLLMYSTIRSGSLTDHGLIDSHEFAKKGLFLSSAWMWKLYLAELWAQHWLE